MGNFGGRTKKKRGPRDVPPGAPVVFFKTISGQLYSLPYHGHCTVGEYKLAMQRETGVPTDNQRFVWARKQLRDEVCLAECCPQQSVISLVLRMRGRGPRRTCSSP